MKKRFVKTEEKSPLENLESQQNNDKLKNMEEKRRRQHLREFSDNTSIHAVKYIGENNRHWIERLFWLLVFITSTVICGYLVSKLWYKWNINPVIVSFSETSTPIWKIPFPAVTICPESKVHVPEFSFVELLYKQDNLTEEEIQNLNNALLVCGDNYVKINKSLTLNEDAINFLEKVAPPFGSAIILCELFDIKINCTNLFKPILTESGICYTFNMIDSNFFEIDQIEMKIDSNKTKKILANTYSYTRKMIFNNFYYVNSSEDTSFDDEFVDNDSSTTPNTIENVQIGAKVKRETFFNRRLVKNVDEIENIKIKSDQEIWTLENGYTDEPPEYVVPIKTYGSGTKNSLLIYTNMAEGETDYVCNPIEGFKIILHNPAETPRKDLPHFYLPIMQGVVVAVKPDMMTTSETLRGYSPEQRQCYFPNERQLKYHSTYTQNNCNVECNVNAILKHCGCAVFYMPRNNSTKICGSGMKKCIKEAKLFAMKKESSTDPDKCNCLPACTSLQYNVETSQFPVNLMKIQDALYVPYEERFSYQTSILVLYFKESQFFTSHRSELYGLTDFLANCGGLIGVCIGFSIISLVEIIYFLFIRPIYYFGRSNVFVR